MNVRRWGVTSALMAMAAALAGSAAADDGVVFQYKMEKGDRHIYRAKMQMKQSQTFMGQNIETDFNTEAISSTTKDGTDEKGNAQLSIKNERMKVKVSIGPLGDYEFDSQSSERDKASMLGALMTPLFERLSTASYQMIVAPDGEVVEVKGYTELLADLVKDNPFGALTGGNSNEAAKQQHNDVFPKLPKKAIKIGETWESKTDTMMPGIGKVRGKSTYRYVGPDKVGDRETAKIEVTSEATIELDLDQGGNKVTGTLTTAGAQGTLHFDVAAGRVLSNESSTSITGDISVNAGGMIIPVRNEQNMKMKVEYLDKLPD
jgi:hypothetical protein